MVASCNKRPLNPFIPNTLFAPIGFNLTWTTSIPLPSILMWPVTAAFGPVASFNLLMLLAPALAAWAAFLLCRHLCGSWWASLLGGYIFGCSDFILSEAQGGHLHMTLVFLVPLAVLAVARAIEGRISPGRLIAVLAVILAAQFLISTEIIATMTMFGAIALALGWLLALPETARRIAGAALPIGCAYAIAAVILSPFIYWLFAFGLPRGEFAPAEIFSSGLLDFQSMSRLPLIVIAIAYASRSRRSPLCRTLVVVLIVSIVIALGPRLHIGRHAYFAMPGKVIFAMPLIDKALPMRFVMYMFLCLAIMVSLWFASNGMSVYMNGAAAAIVLILIWPSLAMQWTQPADTPSFISNGTYRDYLHPNENVLALPFGHRGDTMLWQAETGMLFPNGRRIIPDRRRRSLRDGRS